MPGARIPKTVRDGIRADAAEAYKAGASIRAIAAKEGRSYGTIRTLLLEDKVKLRTRGGTRGGKRRG